MSVRTTVEIAKVLLPIADCLAELDSELYATKAVNEMYAAKFGLLPDGVSIEQLVATYNAVHGPDFEGDGSYPHTDEFLARLRSVKP